VHVYVLRKTSLGYHIVAAAILLFLFFSWKKHIPFSN